MIVCFVLAMGAFYYHRVICLVLLLIFSGMEAYFLLRSAVEHYQVYEGVEKITEGVLSNKIDTEGLHGEDKKLVHPFYKPAGKAVFPHHFRLHPAHHAQIKNEKQYINQ